MRLFLAIRPPTSVIEFAVATQELLSPTILRQGVRFSAPQKMHLTLGFLGDEMDVHKAKDTCASIFPAFGKLALEVGGLGGFPNMDRPKSIWMGVSGEGLEQLSEMIRQAFNLDESTFQGHLTIARVSPGSKAVGRALASFSQTYSSALKWGAADVELLATAPNGEYEVLSRYSL
jgi:2'-5' RNA ligase